MANLFFLIVLLALAFAVVNGFINGGGLISTVIATHVLDPGPAVFTVAIFEVLGLLILGQAVAYTLSHSLVILPSSAQPHEALAVIACALAGAVIWNTSMWWMGLPSSSGHALVGGILGAMVVGFGSSSVEWPVLVKIVLFLAFVPIGAIIATALLTRILYWAGGFFTPSVGKMFRFLQVVGLGGIAMTHGSNDGQKSMAMVLLGLLAITKTGAGATLVPGLSALWLVRLLTLACGTSLALGVIFGSRRVLGTLGKKLYKIHPLQGFCAEASTMVLIGASSLLGYPMSTTQVMSTSVLGAGIAVHPRDVRWSIVEDIGIAWVVTIPAAATLSGVMVLFLKDILHVVS